MNWGNKLLVTFLAFGAGMSFLVYKSITTNYDLVEKDYYKNELRYQEVIDATQRANTLSDAARVSSTEAGIELQLPKEMWAKQVTGSFYLYCAYNARLDHRVDLRTDASGRQLVDRRDVAAGNYLAKISWKADGVDYYAEKPITVQ